MPVCAKTNLPAAALLLLLSLPAAAEFKVTEVQPRLNGQVLLLNGGIDLGLTPKVEEALSKGIQLDVLIDVRLYRRRFWVWGQNVGSWTLRRTIRYHALSGQYLVSASQTEPESTESFLSTPEALKTLGALNDVKLALAAGDSSDGGNKTAPGAAAGLPPEGEYTVEVRASLDIEALPSPLRPVAYTSLAWRLSSGWSIWKLAP